MFRYVDQDNLTTLSRVTQLMMDFVGFTGNNPWLLLIPVVGLLAIFFSRKRIAQSDFFQRFLIKIPIVGPLIAGGIFERRLNTLSLLQKSGANVVDAYNMTIDVSGNIAFREYFSAILEHVKVEILPIRRS